ncbi:acetyltransferase [Candidatus Roizmanbacteria bacterium CG_4_10_14_0_2_um_filter_39_13]|uniref:Acetyltransferase n=1 Tax=Candidatus Roizmanbacteria bacterium CG_4_10_14_0_2_um_filter_39_13 TaxID=1974825 RepID=A0A2M7U1H0_9BACT|nr:MAG: acetyltransferase [Candidatus Roizmanbacteria bacterium CG_4_10_14_0_2_um_filter_39_13]
MNIFSKLIAYFLKLPAQLKGMKFGPNSFIGPGYDFIFLDLSNVEVKKNVMIGKRAWLQTVDSGKILIGSGTHIGRDVVLSARNEITIGENCLLSYRVSILDHNHNLNRSENSPMKSGLTPGQKITIGNNCFIGANVCITKGVTLGSHCVVGANSVVTKSYPDNSIIVGNPARKVKSL